MSTWTSTALQTLERYLQRNRGHVGASGADPDEVTADLRRHVEEEVAALRLPLVTENDVRRIVNQIGPVPEEEVRTPPEPPPARRPGPRLMDGLTSGSLLLFGILLPVITISFELFTRLCSGLLFDPLPSVLHIGLAVLVPAANLFAWHGVRSPGNSVPRWLWLANGAAGGVSLFYTVLFLPLSFFALIAIVYFGVGFLALCPLLSLCCTLRLRTLLKRRQLVREECVQSGWGWACAAGIAALLVMAWPAPLTRHWIRQAGSDSPEESRRALERLRAWGNDGILLRECYGRANRSWIELFAGRDHGPNPELARKVYFRVTGQPFNAVPPPLTKYQAAGRAILDEFEWDAALGGSSVAGHVKGLSLEQSRFDGLCRPDEGWAYVEWILEFRNDHERTPREARAQILLPSGGVVSRLTLWVHGEEREAAFAGKSQVREAYQKVAVVQRRDPVLVTVSGPDRVLVQCFPVPPAGGTIKVRLGITAPLVIESTNRMALRLPSFVERNFAVSPHLEHSFWLESPAQPTTQLGRVILDSTQPGRLAVRGQCTDAELASPASTLRFSAFPKLETVRAQDRTDQNHVVTQQVETLSGKMPGRLAVVLDGSEIMGQFFPEIARAFENLESEPEIAIFFAKDGVSRMSRSKEAQGNFASETIQSLRGAGGQDDMPALLQAWDWAAAKPESAVLWIHGPQPVLLSSAEPLKQRLEWRVGLTGPTVLDVAARPGPNRIAEELANLDAFTSLPRLGNLDADLERLFAIWTGRQPDFRFIRASNIAHPSTGIQAPAPGSSHVVRLWAFDHVKALVRSRQISEALKVAMQYQLVTAWTGAVVLETKEQFKEAGLGPVDPATVPAVPEPGTWALLVFGFGGIMFWRSRVAILKGIKRSRRGGSLGAESCGETRNS